MNGGPSFVRRAISFVAATLAGMAASVAFAAPAAAMTVHDPGITVVVEAYQCKVNGATVVIWDVINNQRIDIELTAVELTPAVSTSTFVPNTVLNNGEIFQVFQTLPAGTLLASLKVFWENVTGTGPAGNVTGLTDAVKAGPAIVKAEFTDNCDGTVTVKLFNDDPLDGQSFTVNGVQHILAPGGSQTVDKVTPDAGGNAW